MGPLSHADYQRFLPGGQSLQRLLAWVKNYVGLTLDWDVRLILNQHDVPPLRLGGGTRIGWSTWLMSAPPTRHPDQLLISSAAAQAARPASH